MTNFFLALALGFALPSAAFAEPVASVTATVDKLMTILNGTNEQQKISQLCGLVQSDLDNDTISSVLLGSFLSISNDRDGVNRFKAAVPSVVTDLFYGLLGGKGGAEYSIGTTVPKGSGKVGVKVVIGGGNFIVTVLRSNDKVIDVEWNNFSLVNLKRDEFQRELGQLRSDTPVTALVNRLDNQGINKCR